MYEKLLTYWFNIFHKRGHQSDVYFQGNIGEPWHSCRISSFLCFPPDFGIYSIHPPPPVPARTSLQCSPCNAILAMQSLQCNPCNAILAMQSLQCNPCNVILAMQSSLLKPSATDQTEGFFFML